MHADLDVTAQAKVVLASFGAPDVLNDWELGWYIYAADIANNRPAKEAGIQLRRSLKQTGSMDSGGVRPDMCRALE